MIRRLAWGVLLACVACGPFDPTARKKDVRVVKLLLLPPDSQQEALGGTRPVQLAAVRIEGGQVVDTVVSTPVDPRSTQRLSVALARNQSWALFLQTPRGNTASLGQLVGRILWSDGHGGLTGRLVAAEVDVDLGELSIQVGSTSTLADNTVLVPDAANPLTRTDRDQDATDDLADTDDDADGTTDVDDVDADGDGLADLDQELAALADRNGREDGDGVPDDVE
ncbi:MAG: hypothetical protein HY904_04785 [Deltaproteobacteria bacterium]|nr:hypothetical protein [Deltaproteobacteria bacterium]